MFAMSFSLNRISWQISSNRNKYGRWKPPTKYAGFFMCFIYRCM